MRSQHHHDVIINYNTKVAHWYADQTLVVKNKFRAGNQHNVYVVVHFRFNNVHVNRNVICFISKMSIFHDEVEIEDMEYDEETETYYYPCPCGDKFEITKVLLGVDINWNVCLHYFSLQILQMNARRVELAEELTSEMCRVVTAFWSWVLIFPNVLGYIYIYIYI